MIVDIKQVKSNPKNPRVIKDDKFKKLVKSIQEFPDMLNKRPLVCFTDTDGKYVVLGGNMRLKACNELKLTEIPIILADEWTEEQKNEFLIKDNVGFGEWDWDDLANEWDAEKLEEWGLDLPKKKEINEMDLFNIEVPFYTPSELKPDILELADLEKTKKLINKIEKLNIPNELKEILIIRASFFTDFNFQKIADFYYKETEDVKDVFKDLGLVILAPKEAIEKGFVNLQEEFLEL